jgi:acetyltransferase-like isoleucine patch superfamily enzyme
MPERPAAPGMRRRAFLQIREAIIRAELWFLRRALGMDIGKDVRISLRAKLDFTYPQGVHIGDGTYVAFDSVIFAHDLSRHLRADTYVGINCFIGAHAIIMPGVRVGDNCIVGSGSVVTKDVPSGSIVAGNPAKVIRSGVKTVKWGILEDRYAEALAKAERLDNER